jgi:S-adenosylmethionine hydrolase
MPVITLLTDFGMSSPYVAAMKGAVLSINPAATIVDLTHAIPPQDIRAGSLVWEELAWVFPPGTIHVAVVDPGVGTDRAIVCARIDERTYVCPDNGLLSRLTLNRSPTAVFRVENREFWRHPVSATFHGRDIMAPVAAQLSLGLDPARLGPLHGDLVALAWLHPVITPGRIEGHVLRVDSFGNVMTNIRGAMLAGTDDRPVYVTCKGRPAVAHVRYYAEGQAGALVSLIGSSGWLELAVIGGNAAETLQAVPGDSVHVWW